MRDPEDLQRSLIVGVIGVAVLLGIAYAIAMGLVYLWDLVF